MQIKVTFKEARREGDISEDDEKGEDDEKSVKGLKK